MNLLAVAADPRPAADAVQPHDAAADRRVAVSTATATGSRSSHAFVALLASALLIWWPRAQHARELRLRDGFLVVALFWVVIRRSRARCRCCCRDVPSCPFTDAVFEAVSGFTTTGATVLERPRLDAAVAALLPRSSCTGSAAWASSCWPSRSCRCSASAACSSTRPRRRARSRTRSSRRASRRTAKALWLIYLAITVACARRLLARGHEPFDAIATASRPSRPAASRRTTRASATSTTR